VTSARVALLAASGVAVYAGAIAISATSDHAGYGLVVLTVAAGVSFTAAGVIATARRPDNRTGPLMLAVALLWALGALQLTSSSLLFSFGGIAEQLAFAPLAHLLLAYPTGRLERPYHRRLVLAVWATVFAGPLLISIFDRRAMSCHGCPDSAFVVWDNHALSVAAQAAYTVAAIVLALAALLELVRRYRGALPPLRRSLAPVYAMFFVAIIFIIAANAVATVSDAASTGFGAVAIVFVALVPVAFLVGMLRVRLARGSVVQLLMALERGTPLQQALRSALGDPSLDIAYWLDSRQRWVDADGRGVAEPSSEPARRRSVTMVERHGARVAALVHDSSLDDEPERVHAVAVAAALSLQTQRLQAELRNQYEFLETLVNTAPSLMLNIDLDGRIINQNAAVVAASGLEDEEKIRGRYLWDVFIDPGERDAIRAQFADAAPDFAPAEYENAFTNAKGEQRVIDWRSAPVLDENGNVTSIIAGGIDITERKRQELELQRERDATDTLVQTIPTLIVVVDENAHILAREERTGINRAFKETLRWSDSEIGGQSLIDLIHPDDQYAALMAIGSAANGVAAVERESRWRGPDGETVVLEWTATPMPDPSGLERTLVLVSATDVTERVRQEEEIRASRSRIVQAADETRRKLERNLHDGAQQRLVALSVSLRLAEAKLESDPKAAAVILAGSREELAHALEELRELARGIHPAVLTDRGLAAAVEALVTRVPVPVDVDLPEERLPASVEAALYYVVAEALTNVVKYSGATSATVRVELDAEGNVTAEVRDDGVGGADPERGSGLRGLLDRVEALDGQLTVESPPGGGTRVQVVVPLPAELSQGLAVDPPRIAG
jgi:PAS domain S-box-containing protein